MGFGGLEGLPADIQIQVNELLVESTISFQIVNLC